MLATWFAPGQGREAAGYVAHGSAGSTRSTKVLVVLPAVDIAVALAIVVVVPSSSYSVVGVVFADTDAVAAVAALVSSSLCVTVVVAVSGSGSCWRCSSESVGRSVSGGRSGGHSSRGRRGSRCCRRISGGRVSSGSGG